MDANQKPLTTFDKAPAPAGSRALPAGLRLLPWLLGTLMLIVYGLTLDHWVSPASLPHVARWQGLTWTPQLSGPVTFLVSYPFGWLPPHSVPLALNIFTAVCAALSLVLLSRSVTLLPHDAVKGREVWQIIHQPPSLLVSRAAWLPPLVAVLVAGLQSSFWENATTATLVMLNLLIFAYVIRCLLEFNARGRDSWLLRGAFAYGLGTANDPAMAVFFPALLLALIWVKHLFIFNELFLRRLFQRPRDFKLRLLWQIPACWLAGLALLLLLPALAGTSSASHLDFWPVLQHTLHNYRFNLSHFPRSLLLLSALIFAMPVVLAAARRWQSSGGQNLLDVLFGPVFFQAVHAFFLLVCLWMMFDPPLSPRRLAPDAESLPLYFLGALGIGYFLGHLLTINRLRPGPSQPQPWRYSPKTTRERQIQKVFQVLNLGLLPALILVAAGIPALLAHKNLPLIALKRADPVGGYINRLAQALPARGAVIIDADAYRLTYLQSALIRDGHPTNYFLLNVEAFAQPGYLDYLRRNNPEFKSALPATNPPGTISIDDLVLHLLQELAKTHDIYSLPPAPVDNVLGEYFYAQPGELLEQLKLYPAKAEFAAPTPPEVLRENDAFWESFRQQQMPVLAGRIKSPEPQAGGGLLHRFLNTLRTGPETDPESVLAGSYYAVALNNWGVTVQRNRDFTKARDCYAGALQLNPNNTAAEINLAFNTNYLARGKATMLGPKETADRLNEYGGWPAVLRDGTVDEPNFCFMLGSFIAEHHFIRPALAEFARVRELVPGRLDSRPAMARLFSQNEDYANALVVINELLGKSPRNEEGLSLQAGVHMRTHAYLAAIASLDQLLTVDPTNAMALLNRGRAYRNTGQFAAARVDYNAVIQSATNAFSAYFDLAQMADLETNQPAAITNYELFLQYAPTNLDEIVVAESRLKALKPEIRK
jgi:tetratricopeptide (TPR) repeat protein